MENFPTRKIELEKYSPEQAKQLIYWFIQWGDHSADYLRNAPEDFVLAHLRLHGLQLDKAILELIDNPHRCIIFFENIANNPTWEIIVPAGTNVTHSYIVDGVTTRETKVEGHAILNESHLATFKSACAARDLSITDCSFDHFYTALHKGFASIEAYMEMRLLVHNHKCQPELRISARNRGGFVTLETRLKEWLPIMTGLTIPTENNAAWNDFLYLKKIRNDVITHPKPHAGFTKISELVDGLNRFKNGIGALKVLLHQAFGEAVPSNAIRAMLYPDVRALICK